MHDIYPVTIISDRYNGCYSGALWTAWNKYVENIPDGIDAGDNECSDFWGEYDGVVGKGLTPDEALADLAAQIKTLKVRQVRP